MQVVSKQFDGTLVFSWDTLPENLRTNIELKNKVFRELQEKYPAGSFVSTKEVFEMNLYVFNRIKSELNINVGRKHVSTRK
jgi:hypothetical protein